MDIVNTLMDSTLRDSLAESCMTVRQTQTDTQTDRERERGRETCCVRTNGRMPLANFPSCQTIYVQNQPQQHRYVARTDNIIIPVS